MPRIVKASMAVPLAFLFVFSIAVIPDLVQLNENGTAIRLNWSRVATSVKEYFVGLYTGDSFRFISRRKEFLFWDLIGSYFKITLFYASAGAVVGMTVGVLAGIYFSLTRLEWLKKIVKFCGSLPDYLIIILLQFLIVAIAQRTGVVIFEVASLNTAEPALTLPLVSAVIVPAIYLLQNVAAQMKLTFTEDYIAYAKARGMGKWRIVFFHALPNVLPYIKADLHKLLGILIGNIFIVEYLFNLHGITQLIYYDAFSAGYQVALVVNALTAMLVVYAIVYGCLRLYLHGWKKVFAR